MPLKEAPDAKERAQKVKIFIHDVHGAITPNVVYCDQEGNRYYEFWHMDGFGDLSLLANGIKPIFLDSTSIDGEGLYRAKELKLENLYYNTTPEEKMDKFEQILKENGVTYEEVGYLGSDVFDLPFLKKVGFAVAPADAVDEVKEVAHLVTTVPAGRGVMREVCEYILRAKGLWEAWVDKVTKMGYK